MARLPDLKRLRKEEMPDAPEWFTNGAVPALNRFMETVYYALNKDLTISANLRAQVKTLELTYRTTETTKIQNPLSVKPIGIWVIDCKQVADSFTAVGDSIFIEWTFNNNQIVIEQINGLTNGTKYNITFIVLGEE